METRITPDDITFDYIMSEQFLIDVAAKKVDINVKLSGRTALMLAIEMLGGRNKSNNAYERVKKLIQLGSNLFVRDNHFFTAIHYACRNGSVGSLRLILEKVASWKSEDTKYRYINDSGSGYTPLYYTCDGGYRKMTQMLINAGVNIEQRTGQEKMPAVYYAAMNGHLRIVKKFPIEMLAKFYQPVGSVENAKSILLGAVYGNEIDVVNWLLWKKVPVTIGGKNPIQPINVAAELEEYAIFKILVPYMSDIEMTNKLAMWILAGRIELFEIVIVQFDKRHLKIPAWGQQANFLLCAIGGNLASARLENRRKIFNKTRIAFTLIDRGEPLNPPLKENEDWWASYSPLSMALRTQNHRLARYMLKKGADPNLGLTYKPLGILALGIYPRQTVQRHQNTETRWNMAWNLMKLCLDYGADPDKIVAHGWKGLPDYTDEGLFTCMIYKSYLHVDHRNEEEKALRTEIFREFVKRGLGFKVEWLNTHGEPSKLVTELLTDSGLWSGAKYDEEEEIYVIDQNIVATRCPDGCRFYGCEHTETPIRLNTNGCKHMFCAGHVRKLIEMNKKINTERRDVGGNQLALTCPVCRTPVKDFQLMSKKQVENWIEIRIAIKEDEEDEIEELKETAQKIRAVYRTFKVPLDKKQLALKRVLARAEQLEKEIKEMEEKKEESIKPFLKQKKDIQDAGIKRRKELRDKQFWNKTQIKF